MTPGSSTEVTVNVVSLVSCSAASPGTATFTQTSVVFPAATVGVVVSGVVHVASYAVAVQLPPDVLTL